MTTFINSAGTFARNALSSLKVVYQDLIRTSEFAVEFYYGRPWEAAYTAASAGKAQGHTESAA